VTMTLSLVYLFLRHRHPQLTLFPYTTLFRSAPAAAAPPAAPRVWARPQHRCWPGRTRRYPPAADGAAPPGPRAARTRAARRPSRSEEHTSELQSRFDLVCRLLLEKKK